MVVQKNHRNEGYADRVCIGVVVGAHGVRGMLRVRSFTEDPMDMAAYGPVSDERGNRIFELNIKGNSKDVLLIHTPDIKDRDAALALKGMLLYVPRAALPEPAKDEFYHGDLIGLRVEALGGHCLGSVIGVHNFGAGDILEIGAEGGAATMIPFTLKAVPEVDLEGSRVIVDLGASMPSEERGALRKEGGDDG